MQKATLASLLSRTGQGLRLNEHLEHNDGTEIFVHACRLGLAGILSKRQDSRATAQAASLTGLGQRIQMHLQ